MAGTGFSIAGSRTRPALFPSAPIARLKSEPARVVRPEMDTAAVDGTIEDSFPASDPPSWTASIARPAPEGSIAPVTATDN